MAEKRDLENEVTALQIGRVALADNIQAVDFRLQALEKLVASLEQALLAQRDLNDAVSLKFDSLTDLLKKQLEINKGLYAAVIVKGE